MRRIRRVLLVLSPWDDPLPLHRSWCMFEVATALYEKKIELFISLPMGEMNAFARAIVEDQHSQQYLVKVLSQKQVQNTETKYAQDKENILEVLKRTKGGFDCVNDLIICEIRKWYAEQLCRLAEKFPNDASVSAIDCVRHLTEIWTFDRGSGLFYCLLEQQGESRS